jgi:cytochrome b6-f complex iron-sulfur subunit
LLLEQKSLQFKSIETVGKKELTQFMKRRSFLSYFGLGWLVAFLPSLIAACTPGNQQNQTPATNGDRANNTATAETAENPQESETEAPANGNGFQAVGTLAALDAEGRLAATINETPIIVVRHPDNPEQLFASNATCPHRECEVEWQTEAQQFSCPCHGSEFAFDGAVLEGPAREPLATYETKVEGEEVLVKVS